MKYLKKYGVILLKFLGFLVVGSLFISVLYYFLFSTKVVQILSFIYLLLVFFLFGYKGGKKAENKGFLAGLKIGGLFLLVLFVLNLIVTGFRFKTTSFIYYFLLLIVSVLGAMFGINTKKKE